MKTIHKIHAVCLLFVMAVGMSTPSTVHAQPGVSISRQDFYNELSPYGQWMNNPSYGQVWRPNVGPDFQPYATDGHWEMTEYGNTWVSDYDWGWAPFHYGRWLMDDYYGWIWVPGDEWGPAWVTWRSGGGYYGWAPLGPGMGIDININIPYNYWVFVPDIYIQSPRVYSYCVPRNRIGNIFGGTVYINNYYRYNNRLYAYGPQRHDIERITRNRINVYRADDIYRQGRYARNNGGSRPYDSRPNYNGNGRNWDNNNGRQNQSPRYDNDNRVSRNDRFDNNNQGQNQNQNRYDQRQNSPQQPRQDDRPYTAPERGNAQRTWSDNGNSNQQPRANREQAPQRSYESRENLPQRRSNDNDQPRPTERNGGSYQQQPQSRGGRESSQPRTQEQGQRSSSENSGEGHRGGRRGN
ncbi:DUF6600 domain-containing protein [Runella sp.]|uniref:DUF6600 domain-containing protein n=1 Tax=Runella sp. TaxID=1960881 RepID=UPI003D0EC7D5